MGRCLGESCVKQKMIEAHMAVAQTYSQLSSARRLKVGAIIVKDDRIISIGYNGMPAGWDNNCEDEELIDSEVYIDHGGDPMPFKHAVLKTKPEVLHAESNCVAKLAKSSESGNGATLFVTHAPCLDCAKLVYQSGINSVFYRNAYRSEDGIRFLEKCNIEVRKI
jgi:dCMP deaminase